jgi:TRAP-type C4-dicarboxylate transport system permease small subunit
VQADPVTIIERTLGGLDRVVEWLLAAVLAVLVLVGGLQILCRYILDQPLSWALEASVLLLVWATMLSGYVGVRREVHLSADFLGLQFSAVGRWRLQLTSLFLCLCFVVVYGWHSMALIDAMDGIPFASLPVTQPVLYWSLPVSAVLMAVALLDRIRLRITQRPTPGRV